MLSNLSVLEVWVCFSLSRNPGFRVIVHRFKTGLLKVKLAMNPSWQRLTA